MNDRSRNMNPEANMTPYPHSWERTPLIVRLDRIVTGSVRDALRGRSSRDAGPFQRWRRCCRTRQTGLATTQRTRSQSVASARPLRGPGGVKTLGARCCDGQVTNEPSPCRPGRP